MVLQQTGNDLQVTVQDDGIGFDLERISDRSNNEGGFGIFSIQERMEGLGGAMEIRTEPEHGCTVLLSLPLNDGTGEPP